MAVSRETLEKLAQFDTPTICNVIELFDVRPRNTGFMDGRIRAGFPGAAADGRFRLHGRVPQRGPAGRAATPTAASWTRSGSSRSLAGPAVMVFQDLDDPPVGATFGEVMCSVYKGFGSTGLITSGGGRDLLQVRALEYPVFTGSTICSHAYCHILHLGLPVRVGGLVVHQGDLLHGDANGVTGIPAEIAGEVADAAGEFCRSGEDRHRLRRGPGPKTIAGLAEARDQFTAALERLHRRVRR